jgi:hypothetical protein
LLWQPEELSKPPEYENIYQHIFLLCHSFEFCKHILHLTSVCILFWNVFYIYNFYAIHIPLFISCRFDNGSLVKTCGRWIKWCSCDLQVGVHGWFLLMYLCTLLIHV